MTADPLDIVGRTIAEKYRIEELAGEGGFALVYRAVHTIWNQPVAVKFFTALSNVKTEQRAQFMDSFVQEGAVLTELSSHSANIVQARDVGTYTSPDGRWTPYMVLEWLEGVPLSGMLSRERAAGRAQWTVEEMMGMLAPVASALDVAHVRGIAHRDIKPGNLFVLGDLARSGPLTIKILDFGLAKLMADQSHLEAALAQTGTNIKSFTPAYGAPEQFNRSYGATGPWTDVFAFALVAIRMLCGRRPLQGDDAVQLAYSACHHERRPTPRALGVDVSDDVERVFAKALALQTTERYARAGEFWGALHAAVYGDRGTDVRAAARAAPSPGSALPPGSNVNPAAAGANAPPRRAKLGSVLGAVGAIGFVAAIAAGALFARERGRRGETPPPSTRALAPVVAPQDPNLKPAPVCPEKTAEIPAGEFFMGSDGKDAQPNAKPPHHVKLDSFCIDLYEVTAADYKSCSDVGKCRRAPAEVDWPNMRSSEHTLYSTLCTSLDPEKRDHPINCVTWQMANTYCAAMGGRLPTEAEWEYAARGPDGRTYPWGDEAPSPLHLNACGTECAAWGRAHRTSLDMLYAASDGYPATAPVGKFPAGRSRFGLFDVAGNVWEWVADWYGPYDANEADNPVGPASGDKRVIRGGAWNGSFAAWLLPSFRYAQDPNAQSHGVGFRCAKSAKP